MVASHESYLKTNQTNKNSIVSSLKFLYKVTSNNEMDEVGTLKLWLCDAMDKHYWESIIKKLHDPNWTAYPQPNQD